MSAITDSFMYAHFCLILLKKTMKYGVKLLNAFQHKKKPCFCSTSALTVTGNGSATNGDKEQR